MDWMAISGYRLPQQLNNSSSNQQVNDMLKNPNITRDNLNTSANGDNSATATSTMLDMWAASKIEAASNSNSSSNLGGGGGGGVATPTTPPITVERSAMGGGSVGVGSGPGNQTPAGQGGISASQASGSISTPGSIKGLNLLFYFYLNICRDILSASLL